VFFDHEAQSHERDGDRELFRAVKSPGCLRRHGFQWKTPLRQSKPLCLKLSQYIPSALSYGKPLNLMENARPSSAMNPGQFDYAQYLKTRGGYTAYPSSGCCGKKRGGAGFILCVGLWIETVGRKPDLSGAPFSENVCCPGSSWVTERPCQKMWSIPFL